MTPVVSFRVGKKLEKIFFFFFFFWYAICAGYRDFQPMMSSLILTCQPILPQTQRRLRIAYCSNLSCPGLLCLRLRVCLLGVFFSDFQTFACLGTDMHEGF